MTSVFHLSPCVALRSSILASWEVLGVYPLLALRQSKDFVFDSVGISKLLTVSEWKWRGEWVLGQSRDSGMETSYGATTTIYNA